MASFLSHTQGGILKFRYCSVNVYVPLLMNDLVVSRYCVVISV